MTVMKLGLGVSRWRVSAAVLRGSQTVWAREVPLPDEASLSESLLGLLREMPRSRFLRPLAVVAVGPSASQLKCIRDLPSADREETVEAMVRFSPGALFTQEGGPLLAGGAIPGAGGAWCATAVEAWLVDQVLDACEAEGVSVRGFLPTALALHSVLGDVPFTWQDGAVAVDVEIEEGHIASVRRRRLSTGAFGMAGVEPEPVVGGVALDAWAAAVLAGRPPSKGLIIHQDEARRSRFRVAGMVAAGMAALAAVGVSASTVAALRISANLQEELSILAAPLREADSVDTELRRVSFALQEIGAFDGSRMSFTLLLDDLARRLPEGTRLEHLVIGDGGTVRMSLLSGDLAAALDSIGTLPGLETMDVEGPVSQGAGDASDSQRASVVLQVNAGGRRTRGEGGS